MTILMQNSIYKYICLGLAAIVVLFCVGLESATAETVDCNMCHPDLSAKKTVHAAVSMGCTGLSYKPECRGDAS